MRRISSRATFYYKRIVPILLIAFLLAFVTVQLLQGTACGADLPSLLIPVLAVIATYLINGWLASDLVDEVRDAGGALLIRNGRIEERVALSGIVDVSCSPWVNPARVTLTLGSPGVFGTRITFCAPVRFVPSNHPAIDDLIHRIEAGR